MTFFDITSSIWPDAGHGMGGADVGAGGHGRHVGRDRDDEAGGGGARARRARRTPPPASGSCSIVSMIWRIEVSRPPGRVEAQHERAGAPAASARVDGGHDVARR